MLIDRQLPNFGTKIIADLQLEKENVHIEPRVLTIIILTTITFELKVVVNQDQYVIKFISLPIDLEWRVSLHQPPNHQLDVSYTWILQIDFEAAFWAAYNFILVVVSFYHKA